MDKRFWLALLLLPALALAQSSNTYVPGPSPYAPTKPISNGQCLVWSSTAGPNLNGAWVNAACGSGGAAPTGPAGGDLGSTYPNPTVLGLTHAIGDLGSGVLSTTGNTLVDTTNAVTLSNKKITWLTVASAAASRTFTTADLTTDVFRSNSGSAMTDTLPSAVTAGAGWTSTIENTDVSASDTITPAAGTIGSTPTYILHAGASVTVESDGTNYQIKSTDPLPPCTAGQYPAYASTTAGDIGCAGPPQALVSAVTATIDTTSSAPSAQIDVLGFGGVSFAALGTGLVKNTTTTGVPSIAIACTDYPGVACANIFTTAAVQTFEGGLTLGGATLSAASWTTNGLLLAGTATTVNDSTSTGTVTDEATFSFPVTTETATSPTIITNLETLYLPLPVAFTNVTATNRWAIKSPGAINVGGVTSNGGMTQTGTTNINNNQNSATNINTGTSTASVTLGGGSGTIFLGEPIKVGGSLLISTTAPTVTSGGGTSPTVTGVNTAAFLVTEGATGTPGTSLVIAMPTALNAWSCTALDTSSASITARQADSGSTTIAVSITFSSAPANNDKIRFQCGAY